MHVRPTAAGLQSVMYRYDIIDGLSVLGRLDTLMSTFRPWMHYNTWLYKVSLDS